MKVELIAPIQHNLIYDKNGTNHKNLTARSKIRFMYNKELISQFKDVKLFQALFIKKEENFQWAV